MDVVLAKCIVLGSLFILTFTFSLLPLLLVSVLRDTGDPIRRARYKHVLSLLSCFAGGVFMGTGLLDLLPEVTDAMEKASAVHDINTNFPIAEFTVAFGFFLVLICEQISVYCKERILENQSPYQDISTSDVEAERRRVQRQGSVGSLEGISDQPHLHEHDLPEEPTAHSSFRTFMLLIALSVHSLFEGLAIGLQPNVETVFGIFLAVTFHKVIIAFSLGLNLVQSNLGAWAIIRSSLLFCIASPLGVGIALCIDEFSSSVVSSSVNGILQGLACGTFVYVTFFEVLPHELNDGRHRLGKLIAVLIGFAMVCGVLFLEPDAEPKPPCIALQINRIL